MKVDLRRTLYQICINARLHRNPCQFRRTNADLRRTLCHIHRINARLRRTPCHIRRTNALFRRNPRRIRRTNADLRRTPCHIRRTNALFRRTPPELATPTQPKLSHIKKQAAPVKRVQACFFNFTDWLTTIRLILQRRAD